MDRLRIDNLATAYSELKEEITKGIILRLPQLRQNAQDYPQALNSFKEDLNLVLQRMAEMQGYQNDVYQTASRAMSYIRTLQELYNETHGVIAPPTLGAAISDAVKECLAREGNPLIRVDDIQQRLKAKGVNLAVKNPPAVIASILARDERLEKIDKGAFRKKVEEDHTKMPQ